MKSNALLTTILLTTTNFAWANGGLSVDNVEQHMNAEKWVTTETAARKIITQGPTDQFDVISPKHDRTVVNTNYPRQAYDGRS